MTLLLRQRWRPSDSLATAPRTSVLRRGTAGVTCVLTLMLLSGCWTHRIIATGYEHEAYVLSEHPCRGAFVLRCSADETGVRCVEVEMKESPERLPLSALPARGGSPIEVSGQGGEGDGSGKGRAGAALEQRREAERRRRAAEDAQAREERARENQRKQKAADAERKRLVEEQRRESETRRAHEAEQQSREEAERRAREATRVADQADRERREAAEAERQRQEEAAAAARRASAAEARRRADPCGTGFAGAASVVLPSGPVTVKADLSCRSAGTRIALKLIGGSTASLNYRLAIQVQPDGAWEDVELRNFGGGTHWQAVAWTDLAPPEVDALDLRVVELAPLSGTKIGNGVARILMSPMD